MRPGAKQKNGWQKNQVPREVTHIFLPAIFLLDTSIQKQRRAWKRASAF
jgi:hypothetical protein